MRVTARRAPKETRPMINESIRLYEEMKIVKLLATETAINRFAFTASSRARVARAQADYDKLSPNTARLSP